MDIPLDPPPPPWWQKRSLQLAAAVPVLVLGFWLIPFGDGSGERATELVVELAPFQDPISGFGTLIPRSEMIHSTPTGARVEQIEVKPGSRVAAGDILMRLSDAGLEKAVDDAATRVAQEELTLEELLLTQSLEVSQEERGIAAAEGRRIIAERELEAQVELAGKGIVSKVQVLRAELEVDLARLEATSALDGLVILKKVHQRRRQLQERIVSAAEADQERARQRLRSLILRAQADGTVVEVLARPGESVAAGTALAWVVASNDLIALVKVAQSRADVVAVGSGARLTIAGQTIAARVARVDPQVTEGLVDVELEPMAEIPTDARLGQSVAATIDSGAVREALVVKNVMGVEANQALAIRIMSQNGTVEKRQIVFGSTVDDRVEIVSGARENDKLMLDPLRR